MKNEFIYDMLLKELYEVKDLPVSEHSLRIEIEHKGLSEVLKKYYWFCIISILFIVCRNPKNHKLSKQLSNLSIRELMIILEITTDCIYDLRGKYLNIKGKPHLKNCDIQELIKNCNHPVDINCLKQIIQSIYPICFDTAKNEVDFKSKVIINLDKLILYGNFAFFDILANVLDICIKSNMLQTVENMTFWMLYAVAYQITNKIYLELKEVK